jgi:hypothetical protein
MSSPEMISSRFETAHQNSAKIPSASQGTLVQVVERTEQGGCWIHVLCPPKGHS